MTVWFDGVNEIECSMGDVVVAVGDLGKHFLDVVTRMPGLANVELVDQGIDWVTIATNEGVMKRTNISTIVERDRVVIEFDEHYDAGKVTTTSHFVHQFASNEKGVTHRLVMSNVEAPGFLGFLYRKFGSSKMGNAFLTAYRSSLARPSA